MSVCYFNVSEDIGNGRKMIDIATDDSDGALFSLTMDSTFKNLATGITYKGTNSITINSIYTETALRYANMKLINWYEINDGREILNLPEKFKGMNNHNFC